MAVNNTLPPKSGSGSESIPLSHLETGSWGVVEKLLAKGALRRRLLDMGLTPRTRVMVRKTAPMGDPIEIHLRSYDLSLRKADAEGILVIPDSGAGARKERPHK